MHFAEAGRSCTEFWLSKCIDAGMQIEVAPRSTLLDMDIPLHEKLYGYHRLDDPKISYQNGKNMSVCKLSEVEMEPVNKPVGMINRHDLKELTPVEPKEY